MKKRILALILAVLMLTAMIVSPAMASTGDIVLNTQNGFVGPFEVFKVFNMTVTGTPPSATYAYTITVPFADYGYVVPGSTPPTPLKGNDLRDYISGLTPNTNALALLRLTADMANWATHSDRGSSLNTVKTTTTAANLSNENKTLTLAGYDNGYYLIVGKALDAHGEERPFYSLVSTGTTNNNVDFTNPKIEAPTIDKKVNNEVYADVKIGDEVNFVVTSNVPSNITLYDKYKLIITDTMSAGLTYKPDSIKVFFAGTELTSAQYDKLTITTPPNASNNIIVDFYAKDNDWFATLPANTAIRVTYTAILNKGAVIDPAPNPNSVNIEYSNDPNGTGTSIPNTPITVDVFTHEILVHKFTGAYTPPMGVNPEILGPGYLALENAKFKLSTSQTAPVGNENCIEMVPIAGGYQVRSDETAGRTFEMSSPANGKFVIRGLGEGTYYLHETAAPANYNVLSAPIEIKIVRSLVPNASTGERDYTVTITVDDEPQGERKQIDVRNNRGSMFPETGGIGRAVFTITGLSLMSAALVAMMVMRKRNRKVLI